MSGTNLMKIGKTDNNSNLHSIRTSAGKNSKNNICTNASVVNQEELSI